MTAAGLTPSRGRVSTAAEIVLVVNARDARSFHAAPRSVYGNRHPAWTPMIASDEAALFDARRNSALRRTDFGRWYAVADRQPIGRIAAFAPHDIPDVGYFGFLETPDDLETARALLAAAEAWLTARGRRRAFGPIAVNPRDQIGLLVEGFESPAGLLTPYNAPYYAALLEQLGYRPAVRLRAYRWRSDMPVAREVTSLGERIAARGSVRVRSIDARRLEAEALLIARLLNDSFAHTWGYVPVGDDEARDLARDLRPVVDPTLCLIAESRGEPCGVAITIPDANWLLRQIDGRLFPLGWLKASRLRRKIPRARFMALGVSPGRRAMGTVVPLMLGTHRALLAGGYREAELSQVFDTNHVMRRLLERMGCPVIKRYAVFERTLSGRELS